MNAMNHNTLVRIAALPATGLLATVVGAAQSLALALIRAAARKGR